MQGFIKTGASTFFMLLPWPLISATHVSAWWCKPAAENRPKRLNPLPCTHMRTLHSMYPVSQLTKAPMMPSSPKEGSNKLSPGDWRIGEVWGTHSLLMWARSCARYAWQAACKNCFFTS